MISSSFHHHHHLLSIFLSFFLLLCPSLSLSRSSFFSFLSATQWRRKPCPSNPLRESGCRVSKTEGKLQIWRARIVQKICLLKLRQEDLPFKAPSRRFAFSSSVKKMCLLKLRQEDLPFKALSRRFACTFGWKSVSECCSVKKT